MALFDELKKNAAGFTENMAKKTSTVIETQKLKMKKTSLESDLRDCYVMLGTIYAKYLDAMQDDQLKGYDILSKVKSIRRELEHISDELLKAKGAVRCPKCGEKMKADTLWDDVETVTVEVEDDMDGQTDMPQDDIAQDDVAQDDAVQESVPEENESEGTDDGEDKTDACNGDMEA